MGTAVGAVARAGASVAAAARTLGNFFIIGGLGLRPRPERAGRHCPSPPAAPCRARPTRPVADMGDDAIVLHFRPSDVFPGPGLRPSHPDYGQPPLGYYLAAVAREGARRVWVVFEDRGNPTVDAAEAALSPARRRSAHAIGRSRRRSERADERALPRGEHRHLRCFGSGAVSAHPQGLQLRGTLACFRHLGVDTATALTATAATAAP